MSVRPLQSGKHPPRALDCAELLSEFSVFDQEGVISTTVLYEVFYLVTFHWLLQHTNAAHPHVLAEDVCIVVLVRLFASWRENST